jgi:uncharacterized membrane protein YecN with MAPEG domain
MPAPVPVTLLYGGLNALLITFLGMQVSRSRATRGVGVETPIPKEMIRAVRAHGNAIEWVPLGLVLLLAIELSGAGSRFTLHLAGGTLLLGRVLHAAGFHGKNRLSTVGAALTYLDLFAMSVWAVAIRFIQYGP